MAQWLRALPASSEDLDSNSRIHVGAHRYL